MGWQPGWNLDTTLNRIVKWYQAWLKRKDMWDKTINEIDDYINYKLSIIKWGISDDIVNQFNAYFMRNILNIYEYN